MDRKRAWLKVTLLIPLVVSLYLYTPLAGNYVNLFRQFPPAKRVFRGLAEFILLLFCSAYALYIWESNQEDFVLDEACRGSRTELKNSIGPLLFAPPPEKPFGGIDRRRLVSMEEISELDDCNDKDESEIEPVSSIRVMNAALDLSLLHLLSLLLFALSTSAGSNIAGSIEDRVSNIAPAMIIPLILFVFVVIYAFIPWKNSRETFWTILLITPAAPFPPVTFRDGFIGDMLTSTVRPLQDVAFTLFYIFSGLQGWWTANYDLEDADRPLERSWLLHKVVLPACMVSPLWWRFCQNLRQAYDHRKRWPYIGNALKYLIAAEVALFGVFNPNTKQHIFWIFAFTCATLYQVWWDIFMDWELFIYSEKSRDDRFVGISSLGSSVDKSVELSSLSNETVSKSTCVTNAPVTTHRENSIFGQVIFMLDLFTKFMGRFRLRPKRLYRYKSMYYCICAINVLLRFCWTLSFIPPSYLASNGRVRATFGSDIQHLINPAIASAEIIRRTLWSLLRIELEAIKRGDTPSDSEIEFSTGVDDMTKMKILSTSIIRNDLSDKRELQVLKELCLYATIFTSLGIVAATH